MATRQSEIVRILNQLAQELPDPDWVALVDGDGLPMACVPPDPPVHPDRISAMTAAGVIMGERVVNEVAGGRIRYVTIAGSDRQHLTIVLSQNCLLTVGLKAEVPAQSVFMPLSRNVPEIVKALKKEFKAT